MLYMYTCAIKSSLKCTAMTWSNQMLSMVWNISENEGALDILECLWWGVRGSLSRDASKFCYSLGRSCSRIWLCRFWSYRVALECKGYGRVLDGRRSEKVLYGREGEIATSLSAIPSMGCKTCRFFDLRLLNHAALPLVRMLSTV